MNIYNKHDRKHDKQISKKMQSHNLIIIISLINLGFFGGFTHCAGMCGPFVLTQVTNNLQNISLQNFSNFHRLRGFALFPYHLGRIFTYGSIGFFCSLLSNNLQEITIFSKISGFLILFATIFFAQNLFDKKFLKINFLLPFNLPKIKNPLIINNLFKNPRGFNGFLLGTILGLIPCGLLYGAFALAASINNPILAALGMFLFGIATFPALFFTASGGYLFLKLGNLNFRIISKILILINIITLGAMSLGLIIK